MPPDEVNKIPRLRELDDAQKALMLSARKESGKFTEGGHPFEVHRGAFSDGTAEPLPGVRND